MRYAFTLVELLVVIGVIAVLIGILLPVLARSRASAQAVQCQSNLRQIGTAMLLFIHDNKGSGSLGTTQARPGELVFFYGAVPLTGGPPANKEGFLYPYLKTSTAVFECPTIAPLELPTMEPGLTPCSYGSNPYDVWRKITKMRRPAETLMLADYIAVLPATGEFYRGGVLNAAKIRPPTDTLATGTEMTFHGRHNRKGNVLWYDMHVSSIEPYICQASSKGRPRGWASNFTDTAMNNAIRARVGHLTPVASSTPFAKFMTMQKEEAEGYFLGVNK